MNFIMDYNENILLERIKKGEGLYLDFKHSINDSKKIARSLCAFANTKGGSLLIGVRDNGSIKGVISEEEYFMVETAAHIYCKPELIFDHKLWMINGKKILEIIIKEGVEKPYYAPDEKGELKAYLRYEDQNILSNRIIREVWKIEKKGYKGSKIIYDDVVNSLMKQIGNKGSITRNAFIKLTGINAQKADKILINLILMKILEFYFSNQSFYYSFTEEFLNT